LLSVQIWWQKPLWTLENSDQSFFEYTNTWDVVDNRVPESAIMKETNRARKKNQEARYHIFQKVKLSIFEKIMHFKTAKEAWDILDKFYKGLDKEKKENYILYA